MESNWMEEYIKDVPRRKWLYKFMKRFLFRRKGLTYKEMYAIIDKLNRKAMGEEESKKHAMMEILEIYKFNKEMKND